MIFTFDQAAIQPTEHGFVVHGIAEGETVVRCWNPDFLHGTLPAAQKRVTKDFPCVHKVTPVDPETAKPVGRAVWACSLAKKDFARYAVDLA
jgi:hypothetical protein